MDYLAHTRINNGLLEVQSLQDHLESTAQIAGDFAAQFGLREWGEIIGLWHDIGKIQPKFQQFIKQEAGIIPFKHNFSTRERAHARIGAVAINRLLPRQCVPMAYCIEGHHGGLPDWAGELDDKLVDDHCWDSVSDNSFLPEPTPPPMNAFTECSQIHQLIRMLFSSLVDADRLDTERFAHPEQAAARSRYDSLETLRGRLDQYLESFETLPSTPLNQRRASILAQCRSKGDLPPAIYSMTVPTGGGKTLSSMAWALNHAIAHGKRRIIVAIPYTSIITQTAAIFRKIFGSDNVLEHHSNLSEEVQTEINENNSLRLSMENWDVPIVVTTNVQLFESLYGNRPSVCRKIHNITNSVLIIDEAQMLPVDFLKPILDSIEGLATLFRTSILLTTATQPVFSGKIGANGGFRALKSPVYELMDDADALYPQFKRTTLKPYHLEGITPEELAAELSACNQVLCIVNTRSQAQQLCRHMPQDTIHLSRNMYSHHLMEQISQIKTLLSEGRDVRVVSTQLIEAGVDIDFPVVYRAMAGLDSIVQAAGRCNREGRASSGDVYVFKWQGEHLQGLMAKSKSVVEGLLLKYSMDELTTPSMLKRYFETYYGSVRQMDKPKTEDLLIKNAGGFKIQFAEYAKKFRLIDDKGSESFMVPNDGGKVIYEKMQAGQKLTLADYRAVQQYTVSVPKHVAAQIRKQGGINDSFEIKVLHSSLYDKRYGVVVEGRWVDEFAYV